MELKGLGRSLLNEGRLCSVGNPWASHNWVSERSLEGFGLLGDLGEEFKEIGVTLDWMPPESVANSLEYPRKSCLKGVRLKLLLTENHSYLCVRVGGGNGSVWSFFVVWTVFTF